MNNNPPQRSRQPLLLPRQPPPQPDVAQHPQQSHVQAQWTGPPPPEQSVLLHTNYDYGPQLQRPQLQYRYPLPPVAQPPPHPRHPAVQPGYNPYQSTAGYHQQYVPHAVASPQAAEPQLPYPHLQPQQQQRHLHHPTPQHLMPARHPLLDGPNLNRQVQRHAPPRPKLLHPLPLAQNTRVYPS
ncbi:hypothetical protein M378DRAFT_164184, partial [Amanita muscaria Koide BX008]